MEGWKDVRTDRPYFIGHFWLLLGAQRYDIETLSIVRALNKEQFYGKSWRKCAPKASP